MQEDIEKHPCKLDRVSGSDNSECENLWARDRYS